MSNKEGSFKEIMGNIPPKARLMLAISVAISGVVAFGFYKMFTNSDGAVSVVPANVNVNLRPDKSFIDKSRPDQEILIPENSPLSNQLKDIKKDQINTAEKKGGSFIEGLGLNNEEKLVNKLESKLSVPAGEVDNIDSIIAKAEADKKRRLEEIEKRKQASRNTGSSNQRAVRASVLFDENAFLLAEINRAKYPDQVMSDGLSALSFKPSLSDYSGDEPQTSKEKASNRRATSAGASNDYSSRISSGAKEFASVDNASMNRYRGINGEKKADESAYNDLVYVSSTAPSIKDVTISAGQMFYAILEIGVNTDEISPVRAVIISDGPLNNAVLVGAPSRLNETAVIVFNKMSVNGKTYSINVVALDPDTMRTGLSDNVDRHTFERYFKLATAAALQGYAEALTGSSTKTFSNGSEQSVRDSLPETSDQMWYAAGKVGEKITPAFEKYFERPPTVTVNGNKELGLMFMDELIISKQ